MQINENFEALGKEALTLTVDATIIAGDIAGYCPLPKCQAISYGGEVIGLAYYGDASNLAGNAAGELANQYVKGKVKIFTSVPIDEGAAAWISNGVTNHIGNTAGNAILDGYQN